jgi:hypothetical protein
MATNLFGHFLLGLGGMVFSGQAANGVQRAAGLRIVGLVHIPGAGGTF